MTAVVDGQEYEDCIPPGIYKSINCDYYEDHIDLSGDFWCSPDGYNDFVIYFKLVGVNAIGTYIVGGGTQSVGRIRFLNQGPNSAEVRYETDLAHAGTLYVEEFNIEKRIMSGSFEFEAFSQEANKRVSVKNGKFNKVTMTKHF